MTSPDWPVLGWVALIALCFVPRTLRALRDRRAARVAAVRRHEWADAKREAELRRVVDQRDRWMDRCGELERDYLKTLRHYEALREHIGDERAAAAAEALANEPAYFEAKAAREAASIDREWLDLDMSEGGPS